jgi:hypothetical protein
MIFDTNIKSAVNESAVKPSPYEPGLSGALMHVYESECNWNAIMKSVGISELRYYNETGKDLFLNEAGAFGGFLEKVKKFFVAIKEKIVSLFKKFVAFISSKTMKAKDFSKKYAAEAKRKAAAMDADTEISVVKNLTESIKDFGSYFSYGDYQDLNVAEKMANGNIEAKPLTSDEMESRRDKKRAKVVKDNGELDESDFREKAIELIYGSSDKEKEDVKLAGLVSSALARLESSDKAIKDAEKAEKEIVKAIDKYIDTIDKGISKKEFPDDQNKMKTAQQVIDLARTYSSAVTVAYGIYLDALKDQQKQDKAIVLKTLSSKKQESAKLEATSEYDLFSGVKLI